MFASTGLASGDLNETLPVERIGLPDLESELQSELAAVCRVGNPLEALGGSQAPARVEAKLRQPIVNVSQSLVLD